MKFGVEKWGWGSKVEELGFDLFAAIAQKHLWRLLLARAHLVWG